MAEKGRLGGGRRPLPPAPVNTTANPGAWPADALLSMAPAGAGTGVRASPSLSPCCRSGAPSAAPPPLLGWEPKLVPMMVPERSPIPPAVSGFAKPTPPSTAKALGLPSCCRPAGAAEKGRGRRPPALLLLNALGLLAPGPLPPPGTVPPPDGARLPLLGPAVLGLSLHRVGDAKCEGNLFENVSHAVRTHRACG